jgi:hypothetical protein
VDPVPSHRSNGDEKVAVGVCSFLLTIVFEGRVKDDNPVVDQDRMGG